MISARAARTQIADALAATGGWCSRNDLAYAMGLGRLRELHIAVLNDMVTDGQVESRQTPNDNKNLLPKAEYRIAYGWVGAGQASRKVSLSASAAAVPELKKFSKLPRRGDPDDEGPRYEPTED